MSRENQTEFTPAHLWAEDWGGGLLSPQVFCISPFSCNGHVFVFNRQWRDSQCP